MKLVAGQVWRWDGVCYRLAKINAGDGSKLVDWLADRADLVTGPAGWERVHMPCEADGPKRARLVGTGNAAWLGASGGFYAAALAEARREAQEKIGQLMTMVDRNRDELSRLRRQVKEAREALGLLKPRRKRGKA